MTAVIIEDEKPSARYLQRMLEKQGLSVLETVHSVEAAVNWFQKQIQPDLIFLDIQLGDGLSFEIFETVTINSPIIFTTAFDAYALQAFKLNSIDYLLKPIDPDELRAAIDKYKRLRPAAQPLQFNFDDIKKLLVNPVEREYKKRFTTRIGQHIKMIAADEIECFYSENKGTYAHTVDGRNYLLDTTLEQLDEELSPEQFFRINRKFSVNINAVKDIISYSNSRLQLKLNSFSEQELIVARERVRDFKLWLE